MKGASGKKRECVHRKDLRVAIMLFQVTWVSGSYLGGVWSCSEPAAKLVYP